MENLEQIALEVQELTSKGERITPEEYERHAATIRAAFAALEAETRDFVKSKAEEMEAAGNDLNAARMKADGLLQSLSIAANAKERETVDGMNTIFWAYCAVLNEEYSAFYKEKQRKKD